MNREQILGTALGMTVLAGMLNLAGLGFLFYLSSRVAKLAWGE